MRRWTTVDGDRPVEKGDTVTLNRHDKWRVVGVDGFAEGEQFVDIELIHN